MEKLKYGFRLKNSGLRNLINTLKKSIILLYFGSGSQKFM